MHVVGFFWCFFFFFFFWGGGGVKILNFDILWGLQYNIYVVGLWRYKVFCGYLVFLGGGGCVTSELYFFRVNSKSKKDNKDQEPIQSSTTPVPGYQMGK